MFIVFGYLAVACFHSLFQACIGEATHPRSPIALITNIVAMAVMIYSVIWQEDISTTEYLGNSGFIIFFANGITMGILCLKRAERDNKCKRVSAFVTGFAISFFPRLICLAAGFYINGRSDEHKMVAFKTYKLAHDELSEGNGIFDDDAVNDRLVELRKLHDFAHGTWHFLSAYVIMTMGLTVVEGLSGRLDTEDWKSIPEFASMFGTLIIAFVFVGVEATDASSEVYLTAWFVLTFTVFPICLWSVVKIVAKQHRVVEFLITESQRQTLIAGKADLESDTVVEML